MRRIRVAVGVSLVGLVLVSCDNVPTRPGDTLPPPSVQRSTGPIAFVSDRDGTDRIYLANEDGSGATPLVMGWDPAWARDGRQIAFRTVRGFDIHVIGVNGSGDRVIAGNGTKPSWSPDGRSLAFMSWRPGSEIDVVNLDGSNRRSVFDSGGYLSWAPKWSPDGQRILFSIGTYMDWCFGLWTVNADGSDARQLGGPGVGGPSGSCYYGGASLSDANEAAWSRDGSEIAFWSNRGIEVVRADGSGRHLRVPGPAVDPDWTPDGRLIYTKGPPVVGPARIFISDGGTERQLIPDATAPARPSYRDSQAVWVR